VNDYSGFAKAFVSAATALANNMKNSGFTGNGVKKLDFKAGGRLFTALEQNMDKASVPGKLAREGRKIVQIRDGEDQVLAGFVDVDDKSFNAYSPAPNPIDISEIEKIVDVGDVKIQASGSSTRPNAGSLGTRPAQGQGSRDQGSRDQGQESRSSQGRQQNRSVEGDPFAEIIRDKAA
jgi:hypothetical protein